MQFLFYSNKGLKICAVKYLNNRIKAMLFMPLGAMFVKLCSLGISEISGRMLMVSPHLPISLAFVDVFYPVLLLVSIYLVFQASFAISFYYCLFCLAHFLFLFFLLYMHYNQNRFSQNGKKSNKFKGARQSFNHYWKIMYMNVVGTCTSEFCEMTWPVLI